jgi:hypothetical protein
MIEQDDKEYFNVTGMMIYDPSIQYAVTSQVAALPFVDGQYEWMLSKARTSNLTWPFQHIMTTSRSTTRTWRS